MKSKILKNTVSLYIMNIAKLILPLITLPYLTRVLSKDCYGVVSYVKAVMTYMQIFVDFGFMLSGTNDIIRAGSDKKKLECEIGDILAARLILAFTAFIILMFSIQLIPILKGNAVYLVLSFIVVFLTCFLFDYFFRGIEEMQIIAARFICMKFISSTLTFIFVKSDEDILMIPILDIIGSFVAVAFVFYEFKKMKITVRFTCIQNILRKIKVSAVFFLSSVSTTAFTALNTLLIGIYATESQIAEWSLCTQMVGAVQAMYSPILDGIYPEMIKSKNRAIIKKTLKIFMPIIFAGCVFTFIVAKYALLILGGEQYVNAENVLRALIPVLFMSFPAMLLGWTALGAIGHVKETTGTTIFTAVLQVIGLIVLIVANRFTLINIALLRGFTEFILFLSRFIYCVRFRKEFN